jgi:hypothetical protein
MMSFFCYCIIIISELSADQLHQDLGVTKLLAGYCYLLMMMMLLLLLLVLLFAQVY